MNLAELLGKQKQFVGGKEKWHYVYEIEGHAFHQLIPGGDDSNVSPIDDVAIKGRVSSLKG